MLLLVLTALLLEKAVAYAPPPCDQYTALVPDEFGRLMARIKVPDPGGNTTINVTIYTRAKLDRRQIMSSELHLVDSKRRSPFMVYNLHFPTHHPLPIIGMITFNYITICQESAPSFDKYLTTTSYVQQVVRQKYLSGSQIRYDNKIKSSISSKTIKRFPYFAFNVDRELAQYGNAPKPIRTTPEPVRTTPEPVSMAMRLPPPETENLRGVPCGQSVVPSHLIYGGMPTTKGHWPWLANVYLGPEMNWFCGATVISMMHVITAAHCMFQPNGSRARFEPEDVSVALGQFNRSNMAEEGVQIRMVKEIVTHGSFKPKDLFLSGDIAVLTLDLQAMYTPYVRPICLWDTDSSQELIYNQVATVVGWGARDNMELTDIPFLADIPIVSEEECYNSHPTFNEVDHDRVLCGGYRTGVGPCKGDSGSGLALQRTNRDGSARWYLRGVVSFTAPSNDTICNLDSYSLFTDVAKYARWIKMVMRTT